MQRTIHVIGAGVSGLAAAIKLTAAGQYVHLHEATPQAGGRCRSFYDAATDLVIDNGNHLVLSGNHHVMAYARSIGSDAGLQGPADAEFAFVDLATQKRWTVRLNRGPIPFWIFRKRHRVPDTGPLDYLALMPLLRAKNSERIDQRIACEGALYEKLVRPLLLAALNIEPPEASAGLAGAIVRETLLAGGGACRPLIARDGLSTVLVEPAIEQLKDRGAAVSFEHELHKMAFSDHRVATLTFGSDTIQLGADDVVVLAVPAKQATTLLPGLKAPTQFTSILNAHFRFDTPMKIPPILGVINGLTEWIFPFPHRLSVTISGADRLMNEPREDLARQIWQEVCAATGVRGILPPWQIVRERRATFTATPEQDALRPGTATALSNLFLAGDWTNTGLPSTIEGSIRSGDKAADHVLAMN
jgi:squalene-associated FAD-dependent desaturase